MTFCPRVETRRYKTNKQDIDRGQSDFLEGHFVAYKFWKIGHVDNNVQQNGKMMHPH